MAEAWVDLRFTTSNDTRDNTMRSDFGSHTKSDQKEFHGRHFWSAYTKKLVAGVKRC